MKVKSSVNLPPDPKSMAQHIRRANYQTFEWSQVARKIMIHDRFTDTGWKWDEEQEMAFPIWFEGNLFFEPACHCIYAK